MWCLAGCGGGPGTLGCSAGRVCLGRVPVEGDGAMPGAAGGREVQDKPQRAMSSVTGGMQTGWIYGSPPPSLGEGNEVPGAVHPSLCRGAREEPPWGWGALRQAAPTPG